MSIAKSMSDSYVSTSAVGSGQFRTSLKYFAHCTSSSSSVVNILSHLSVMGASVYPQEFATDRLGHVLF